MTGSNKIKTADMFFGFICLFFTKTDAFQKKTGIKATPRYFVKIAALAHMAATKRFFTNLYLLECRDKTKKYNVVTVNAINRDSLNKLWVFHSIGKEIEVSIADSKAIPSFSYNFFINKNVKIEMTA